MKLEVIYKGSIRAGYLWREVDGFYFEYEDAFLNNKNTFPISVNMPTSQKTYFSPYLFSNFQSMLSEGYNREIQCKSLGIDLNDDWSLLMHTCEKDTIGAITLKKIIQE